MPDLTIQDYDIVQENGNLVAKDANDNTVLTYNDAAGQWEFGTVSAGSVSTGSINSNRLSEDYLFAGSFEGNDPDDRLDAALSAAMDGQKIYLEAEKYSSDRTISKAVALEGPFPDFNSSEISSGTTWTLDGTLNKLTSVRVAGEIVVNSFNARLSGFNLTSGIITINSDKVIVQSMSSGTVTFASGTSAGIVDVSSSVIVNDNGTNTVGDIA